MLTTYNHAVGSRARTGRPTSAAERNIAAEPNPGRPVLSQYPLATANIVLEWSPALVPLLQAAVEQRPGPSVGRPDALRRRGAA